jgi:hypothetical protein
VRAMSQAGQEQCIDKMALVLEAHEGLG